MINKTQVQCFISEAYWFLEYSDRTKNEWGMINPRLVDMGDLTHFKLTGMPPAYREITNEAFDVWNADMSLAKLWF